MAIDSALIEAVLDKRLSRNTRVKQKGELCFSDCPKCGAGTDRFWVNPGTETFWCRACKYSGWVVDLLVDHFDMTKDDALKICGKHLTDDHQVYVYQSPDGTPLFEVHAIRKPGEPKKIWQSLPGSRKGAVNPQSRAPYNLPNVIKARTVFVVEGEKKVELFRRLDLTATTNAMGAGKFGAIPEKYIQAAFAGKNVVIVPDNDDPGRAHAIDVAERLGSVAKEIKICTLPDLKEGEGPDDFMLRFGNERLKAVLNDLITNTKPFAPKKCYQGAFEFVEKDTSAPEPIVQGILERGQSCLLAAEYGQMKSLFRLQLAIHIGAGLPFLNRKIPHPKTVAIFQWENSEHLEQKRLKNMLRSLGIKAKDLGDSIRIADRRTRFNLVLQEDRSKLMETVKAVGADVIMFDNLSNMHQADENDNIRMRGIVDFLSDINAKFGTSTLLVHHMSKPSEGRALRHRIRGAISLQDWADNILTLSPATTPEEQRIVKALRFEKVRDPDETYVEECFIEFDRERWLFTLTSRDVDPEGVAKILAKAGDCSYMDLYSILQKDYRMSRRHAVALVGEAINERLISVTRTGRNSKRLTSNVELEEPHISEQSVDYEWIPFKD